MSSSLMVHSIPHNAIVLPTNDGETDCKSQTTAETLYKKSQDFSAFLGVWDVSLASITMKSELGFWINTRWKFVNNHPSINVRGISIALKLLFTPRQCARRLITCFYTIHYHASRAL